MKKEAQVSKWEQDRRWFPGCDGCGVSSLSCCPIHDALDASFLGYVVLVEG